MTVLKYSKIIATLLFIFVFHLVHSNNTDRFNYRTTVGRDFGPNDWDQVTCDDPGQCSGWPDGWELGVGWELSENKCHRSCPVDGEQEKCDLHQQSPIDLLRAPSMTGHDNECYDYHWMAYQDGSCNWHDMIKNGYTPQQNQFQIRRHALQILQPIDEEGQLQCLNHRNGQRNFPRLDYSKGFPDWWFLSHTEVTVPSEHTQEGVRYDAEVHLAHFYSVDFPEDERKLGKVAIFLSADDTVERWDYLDKLICQWREVEEATRHTCGLPSVETRYPGCRNPQREEGQPKEEDPYPFIDCDLEVQNSQRICKPTSCCEAERSTTRYCQNDVYDKYGEEKTGSICWWCCPGKLLAPKEGSSMTPEPTTSPGTTPPTLATTPEPTPEERHDEEPPESNVQPNPFEFLSFAPSYDPSNIPSSAPSSEPTTVEPTTVEPTTVSSTKPSAPPSSDPTVQPSSNLPSFQPSGSPIVQPTNNPSTNPSIQTSNQPTADPSINPTSIPPVPSQEEEQEDDDNDEAPSSSPTFRLRDSYDKQRYRLVPKRKPPRPSPPPSCTPAVAPSQAPSLTPSSSLLPSTIPTTTPSISRIPTTASPISKFAPTSDPSTFPSLLPDPTPAPTSTPTPGPTSQPTPYPTSVEPTWNSSGSLFLTAPPASQEQETAPPLPTITCSDYRNNTRINFKRICREDGCCDSDQRSASTGCHYAYSFFGDQMNSICRDCCSPSKEVAPAPPSHPTHPTVDCALVENPFRICKPNSCCDSSGQTTDYCEATFETYGTAMMGSICWYCCSQPKDILLPDDDSQSISTMNITSVWNPTIKMDPKNNTTSVNNDTETSEDDGDDEETISTNTTSEEEEMNSTNIMSLWNPIINMKPNTTDSNHTFVPEENKNTTTNSTLPEESNNNSIHAGAEQRRTISDIRLPHYDENNGMWASDVILDPSNFRVSKNLEEEYLADIATYRQRKQTENQNKKRRKLNTQNNDDVESGNNYHHVKYSPYEWMREVRTEYYYRYEGSQMVPPCFETVHYRVMKDPIRIHPQQLQELQRLLANRIDPETCQVDTAGRFMGPNKVELNRPLQEYSNIHRKVFCECQDWDSKWQEDQDWCELEREERFYQRPYNFS